MVVKNLIKGVYNYLARMDRRSREDKVLNQGKNKNRSVILDLIKFLRGYNLDNDKDTYNVLSYMDIRNRVAKVLNLYGPKLDQLLPPPPPPTDCLLGVDVIDSMTITPDSCIGIINARTTIPDPLYNIIDSKDL